MSMESKGAQQREKKAEYRSPKIFYTNGDIYEGEWLDDELEGYGVRVNANGDKYEGHFKEGKSHGLYKETFANGEI